MHPNAVLIGRLYEAFADRDAERMAACYHPDATFSDPVFPALQGEEVANMWRMLTANARDFRLTLGDVQADDATGAAHWEAHYTFPKTRRPIHNIIEARFEFRDGLIIRHVDSFDFWRWSRMALGATGTVLGWSSLLRDKVRREAAGRLAKFSSA